MGGGGVRTNVFVRDMDLVVYQFDTRRLEVVLLLFQGAQVAIDTTLVCPLTREGVAQPRTATVAGEFGGRFSDETAQFLRALASAKVQEIPQLLQGDHAAWLRTVKSWRVPQLVPLHSRF